MSVSINPVRPLGSESLSRGPEVIQAIARAICDLFGLPTNAEQQFGTPFGFSDKPSGLLTVVGEPTAALGVATKGYVDNRAAPYAVVSGVGNVYSGSAPGVTAYRNGAVYVFRLDGATVANAEGGTYLNMGAGSAYLKRPDGTTDLYGSELRPGSTYAATYDSTLASGNGAFVLLTDWVGGTVLQPIVLPGDPGFPFQAATKNYVDGTSGTHPEGQLGINGAAGVIPIGVTMGGLGAISAWLQWTQTTVATSGSAPFTASVEFGWAFPNALWFCIANGWAVVGGASFAWDGVVPVDRQTVGIVGHNIPAGTDNFANPGDIRVFAVAIGY